MGTSRSLMPAKLRAATVAHGGIVSRQEAMKGGMTPSAIRQRVASLRWQQIYPGVYAIFTGGLGRRSELWAALVYAGDGAILSHETAGELQNLTDGQSAVIHVTVPHSDGRQICSVPGLVVHRSRRGDAEELRCPEGELPRTEVEDTILDIAAGLKSADAVCALVARAFARSLTSVDFMRMALARRKRQRWRHEIEEFVAVAAGGADSVLEFHFDRDVERAHGLPPSRHQVPFVKTNGKRGYRDRVYEKYKVIVELDGRQTHTADNRADDKARDNAAAEGGEQSLRYEWSDVRWHACDTAAQVASVLRARGWNGTPAPCSAVCAVGRRLTGGSGILWMCSGRESHVPLPPASLVMLRVMRPSLYEVAGGDAALLRLATAHHARCLADPELNHPFSHPDQNPKHVERLAAYWGEVLGGPPAYTEHWGGGESFLVGMHAGMGDMSDLARRFVDCFVAAADDAGLPEDKEFRSALRAYMEWAVGDIALSHPHDTDVPAGLSVPHWSWGGLVTAP